MGCGVSFLSLCRGKGVCYVKTCTYYHGVLCILTRLYYFLLL